jgi:superoxide dismutase, Fe-Mn family
MRFELPDLPFELNALEPYISKKTLEFHHGKHHQSYLANLNKLIQGTKFKDLNLETIIKVADGPIFNNAAQVWNHTFYFECLKPGNCNFIKNSFEEVIKSNFGSIPFFKSTFTDAVGSLFGVGWVWLVLKQNGSMEIIQKFNAGNPMRIGLIPLMTCDVWEHAYYLDYQNRLGDYADAFWELINWDIIEKRYIDAVHYQTIN